MQKKKYKVTKQVYHVKKDKRLSKSSDLTQEIEKQTVEEISATPVDQIVPISNLALSDIAEQDKLSWGARTKDKYYQVGKDQSDQSLWEFC